MYLLDTNVISERRKGRGGDRGVIEFLEQNSELVYLPVQVVGELRYGAEALRRRGAKAQAKRVEAWLQEILDDYSARVLPFDLPCANVWGRLRGLGDQNQIDKQIAAIALIHDLTVVTRNTGHFVGTEVRLLNPFRADAASAKRVN